MVAMLMPTALGILAVIAQLMQDRGIVKEDFDQENGTPDPEHIGHYFKGYTLSAERTDLETILVQFLALGLIERSTLKNRSVKDRGDYWTLTPYGTTVMNQLRAISKPTADVL